MRFSVMCALFAFGVAQPALTQTPLAPPAAIAPAKLAVSKSIASRIWPDGTIKRVMSSTMDQMMGGMMDKMMDMPVDQLAKLVGVEQEKLEDIGSGTIREVLAIVDPAFQQRSKLGMDAIMGEMSQLMTSMEPELRAGLAEAYANQFSASELGELDRFFATPTGIAYAAKSMTIQADPAFMSRMQNLMPKIFEAMPNIVKRAETATASLPKSRKMSELSTEERARLAKLLGVKPADLK